MYTKKIKKKLNYLDLWLNFSTDLYFLISFFAKVEKFFSDFLKSIEKNNSFQLPGNQILSWKKGSLIKYTEYCRKTPFLLLKSSNVDEFLKKYIWKIWPIAWFKPVTCGVPNHGATLHMYYASCQRFCRHKDFARHGQFQENEKNSDYWTNIFLSIYFFDGKLLMQAINGQ